MKSPNTKRMDQMKEEILKAAQNSPLLQNIEKPLDSRFSPKLPDLEIRNKGTLEALVSPRASKQLLPQLMTSDFKLNNGATRNVFSPGRVSVGSKFSQYSTFSTPFFNKENDAIKQKLEYEWKNIFRSLNTIDLNSSGCVTKKEFMNSVQKHGVFLSRVELNKLFQKYCKDGEVNYIRISSELGLHKTSYDYMKTSSKYLKNASLFKSMHGGFNDSKSQLGDL